MSATRLIKSPVLPVVLILVGCATWFILHAGATATGSKRPPQTSSGQVFFVSPAEETIAETVPEWANQAELVVKAHVTSEEKLAPPVSETANEDGFDLIGRTVSLDVSEVIWRSPDATRSNPARFSMNAWGWMRSDTDGDREVAVEGTSRLEVGHDYVLALEWREAACAPGDEAVPAHWSVLSSQAALPADDDTIGVGELEGSEVDLRNEPSDLPAPPESALARFAGEHPAALRDALNEAAQRAHAPVDGTGECAR